MTDCVSWSEARARIAIVEDDPSMVELLAYNLQAAGHLAAVVATGALALERLHEIDPDLIILDWELPGLSGMEILRQIRRNIHTRDLPVIILTGRSGRDDRSRAMATGADAFVTKPFALSDLLRQISALLAPSGPSRQDRTMAATPPDVGAT